MNTPKLSSIQPASLAQGALTKGSQTADPLHGLMFSKLLGDMQLQNRAPSTQPPGNRPESDRSGAGSARTTSPAPSRIATAERPADRSRPDHADASQAVRTKHEKPPAAGAHASASSVSETEREPVRPNEPSAESDAAATIATSSASEASQAAAEAGMSPLMVSSAADLPVETPRSPIGAAGAAPLHVGVTSTVQAAALPAQAVSHAANPDALPIPANTEIRGITRAPTLVQPAAAPSTPVDTAAVPLPATTPALASVAAPAALAQFTSGPGKTLAAATVSTSSHGAPTIPKPAVVLSGETIKAEINAPTPPALITADTLYPVASAADLTTAASRSLQDFTSMVAAARATSGTSLAPTSSAGANVAAAGSAALFQLGSPTVSAGRAVGATVAAPLGSPQWPTEFGRQFISIAQAGKGLGQIVELRLDPPDLGPLRISISLTENIAHAVISSPHALVRQTVENALPQLQQMLEQAGISLGQANVNDQSAQGQGFGNEARNATVQRNGNGSVSESGVVDIAAADQAGRTADPSALVDTFA